MNMWLRNFIILTLMLAASGMAIALRPTHKVADKALTVDLQAMIPQKFGNWTMDDQTSEIVIDPEQKAEVDKYYSAVLSRVYFNHEGRRIMLSLAYGENQTRSSQVHKPEVCYPAQGFIIKALSKDEITGLASPIPVARMVAVNGSRREAVIYWMRFGDEIARGTLEQNFLRLKYGFKGQIPDGLLFRVSEITNTPEESFELQSTFVQEFLRASSRTATVFFLGGIGSDL